jgi:hypothetical protein
MLQLRDFSPGGLALASMLIAVDGAQAAVTPVEAWPLKVTGDAQLRYENHDTTRPGVFRQERVRLTAHVVGTWAFSDDFALTVGARTGELGNQHSPTVTLKALDDHHGYGKRSVYLDRWALTWRQGPWRAEAGRALWPFFSVSDAVWDTDVNPAGLYLEHAFAAAGKAKHTIAAAAYRLPDGALRFTGRMATLQARREQPTAWGKLTTAAQWLQMEGEAGARYAAGRPNERDYRIGELSASLSNRWRGHAVSAGVDLFHNFATYPAIGPDTLAAANRDERTGYSLALSWGENKRAGDWRLRYNFTCQEMLAVNPAMSEDTQSRLGFSNYLAHDFRAIYSIRADLTVTARYIVSEQIVGSFDADRFRIDLEWKF